MIDLYQAIRKTLEFKRLLTGLLAGLLLFVTLILGASYKLKRENELSGWVLHSQEEIYQIEKTISLVKDYETGSRGFILTNQDSYEQPLTEASKTLDSVLVHLEELIAGDAVQKQHLDSLSLYLHKKIDFSTTAIKVRREQGLEQALSLIKTNVGKEYMDKTRHIADAMHLHAKQVLAQRKKESAEAALTANQILFASIVFFIFLLLYVLWKSWQQEQEKRIAGEKLKQKEEYYRALIENNSDAIVLRNEQEALLYWSPAAERILGWTKEEASEPAFELEVHPDDLEEIQRQKQQILNRPGCGVKGLHRIRHQMGHYVWLEGETVNLLHQESVKGIVTNFRDVSDRVKADLEVQKATSMLEKVVKNLNRIMDSSLDVICTIDAQGRFEQVSAASATIWGYAPEELVGRPYMDLVADFDKEITIQVAGSIMSGIAVTTFENHYLRKDGNLVPVLWSAKWNKDDQMMYCVAKDATEKKKLEQAFLTELRQLIHDLPAAVYTCDTVGGIKLFNKAAVELWGSEPQVGKEEWVNSWKIYDTAGQPLAPEKRPMALTLKKGVPVHGQEIIIERHNGERRNVMPHPVLSYDAEGQLTGGINILMDITDSRRASEQIRKSEADLAEAQEIAKIGSWNLDMPSERLTCSSELYRIFGTNKETFRETFSSFLDFVDEADLELAIQTTHNAYNTGEPFEVVYRITSGLGEKRVLHVIGNSQSNAEGQVVRLYVTAQDITERKQFETDLQASEEKYKLLFYQAPLPKWIYDLENLQILDVNDCAIDHYGYSREEFLSMTAQDLRPPEEVAAMLSSIRGENFKEGLYRFGTWTHIKKDGTHIKVEISAHSLRYDNRSCLIVVANDVTERARAEQALKLSNYRWEMLSKVTFDAIWDWDLKTDDLYWGDNFESLFGHRIENNIGSYQSWANYLHEDDKQRVTESVQAFVLSEETSWQEDYRYLKGDGEYAYCTVRGILIRDEQGVPYRMIGALRDVTESKLAEENLRNEKTFSDTLLEATPDGMVGFNDKGEIILFNKKAESLFGYSQEEILGSPLVTLLPKQAQEGHDDKRKDFFDNPENKKLQINSREMIGLRRDGHLFPADVRLNYLHSNKGKIVITSIRDITERKLAEMQLKESEKNLKAILSSSQEAIYLLDLNCRLVLLNEHSRDILRRGFGVVCKPGDDFPALFEPALGSLLMSIYERVLAGEKYDTERLYPLEDGDAYYYSTYFPVKDNEGNIIGICCAAKNITPRKQIEEAIRIANAEKEEYQYRFKAILDYSPQAILIKDMDGKYIFSNKAFLDLFDLDISNEVGQQLKAVFNDEEIRAEFLSCMEGNPGETKSKEWEQQVLLPNGQTVVLEIIKFPLYDRQKQLFGVCTLCKDITEQMHHQQQLIVARENAEQAERLQEQFLANMSHELRTPMNGIIGMVNLLLTSSSLQPDQTGRLQVIKRSSDTLLSLINDILDLSKIKAGMLTIEKVNFDFNESIAGTAMLFKERAKDKGVKLVVAADPFIPRLLCGDPHRLNQILNNLLSNAVKFTDKGFVRLEASLQSESEDQVVIEFIVSDSGIGIDAGNLHYIFDNFAQASTDISSKYGGTGLGLAITKRLIEMQGGEISVGSTKGVGTTFTFHLPYAITKDTDAVVNPYYHQTPAPVKKNYSGKRALIVEDNDINQAVLISSLQQHHIEHLIANNGQEAVDLLESGEKFDIVFMDLRMPVMNGFQTTAYIRQKLQLQVPIVVLTASVLRNERDRCLEIGASDYMAKPFAMADLARALDQFLPASDQQTPDNRATFLSETASMPVPGTDFDISRLLELDAPENIRHILTLFTGKMPAYLQELKIYLPAGNWEEFLEKTHKIKGSLSTIQIREINELILAMEEKVQEERNLSNIMPLLEKCLALYDQIIPAIQEEVEKQLVTLEPNY